MAGTPLWLLGREELSQELEVASPFCNWALRRRSLMSDYGETAAGTLKGALRLRPLEGGTHAEKASSSPPHAPIATADGAGSMMTAPAAAAATAANGVACTEFLRHLGVVAADVRAQEVVVRVYVLRGVDLPEHDLSFGSLLNGRSDPYVTATLGDQTRGDGEGEGEGAGYEVRTHENESNPEFRRVFEFDTTLPGPAALTLRVKDHDVLSKDDVIGETVIDIEERFFSAHWRSLGRRYTSSPSSSAEDDEQ